MRMRASTVVAILGTVLGVVSGARAQSPSAAFVNFESGHVRPLALSPSANRLFAVNTPDNRLAIYDVGAGGLTLAAEVPVGLEPVAVAARSDTEVWVVNHLSDSVSIVQVNAASPAQSRVVRTLLTCDEPRDIVFAGSGNTRAFITTARRGQNCPLANNAINAGTDRAVVQVFDATALGASLGGTPIANITLFTDTPRALARTPAGDRVFAAGFHTGNRTTAINEQFVSPNGGLPPPPPGSTPGAPPTGLIVRFNGTNWVDEINRNWSSQVMFSLPDRDVFVIDATAATPALVPSGSSVSGVGTILFNMAVRPTAGNPLYVANTDARNFVRFEPRISATLGVQGNIAQSRITIVNGTTPTPRHLNPHIDYSCVPPGCLSPQSERDQSLAIPTDMVFSADGSRLYVAGFGSGKIGIFDAAALEAGTIDASTKTLVPVGAGPSGVVLDEGRNRLYVMNRIDHDISIVSNASTPATAFESAVVPLRLDPSPPAARDGRIFLYDALHTSAHGDQACASCHVFGDFDSLAWDLGNPFGQVVPNDNPFRVGGGNVTFHPMKGPMTTQTLRGMSASGPMHWRGDRTGSTTGGDALDERLAFNAFNPAFVSLLGRATQLTQAEMNAFTDFILTVKLPPNPIRSLDNVGTSDQNAGQNLFQTRTTDAGALTCSSCHALPLGTDGFSSIEGETQEFKIPHLRNLYQKVGMFGFPGTGNLGNQVRGFGFLHDGSVPTLQIFVSSPVFQNLNTTEERQLEQFLLAFDTGLRPAVGQQVSIDSATFNTAAFVNRINLLVARADAGDCDLVVKGNIAGEARGAVYVGGNAFQPDRHSDATLSTTAVRQLAATAGQEVTFTCVPPGSGVRIGVDRDLDGVFDRRELDCGTDPANPASRPVALTGPCGGGTTTTTTTFTTTTTIPGTTTTTTTVAGTTTTTVLSTTTTTSGPGTTTTTTLPAGATVNLQSDGFSLKDKTSPPVPDARKVSFKTNTRFAAPANKVVVPSLGGTGDPTLHGATLTVYNSAGSGEKAVVTLPSSGWTADAASGSGAPRGYRWKGTGAITQVTVKADLIKVKGGGAAWPYTLNEPSQGRMALRLQLGSQPAWCADTPPKTSGNPPSSASYDRVDRFNGQPHALPPATCPPVP